MTNGSPTLSVETMLNAIQGVYSGLKEQKKSFKPQVIELVKAKIINLLAR